MSRSVQVMLLVIAILLVSILVVLALLVATRESRPAGGAPIAGPGQAAPTAAGPAPTSPARPSPTQPETEPTALPAPSATPPAPTAAPTEARAPVEPASKYGIHLLLDDDRNHWLPDVWPQHVQAARQIVGQGGYVVQLIRLDDLDVGRWQYFLDLCAAERLVPIIRLATTYDHENKWWEAPPKDDDGQGYRQVARRYGDFLGQLRWPSASRYAIVHNEANRGDEWSNRPDPAEYARFLLDVGQALHEAGITVLAPALDLYAPHSNGRLINGYRYIDAESFIDGMYAAEPRALDTIDIWAAHAYPLDPFRADPSRQVFQIDYANGATNPRHVTPPAGLYNRGVNSYRWELWKLEQYVGPRAAELPVFVTESGWRHGPSQDAEARDSVHAEISFETMSAYLDLAFHGNGGRYPDLAESGWTPWTQDRQVLGVVLFALGGFPKDWGHTNWVVVDERGGITAHYPLQLRNGTRTNTD